jgi:hypothetical protein
LLTCAQDKSVSTDSDLTITASTTDCAMQQE